MLVSRHVSTFTCVFVYTYTSNIKKILVIYVGVCELFVATRANKYNLLVDEIGLCVGENISD